MGRTGKGIYAHAEADNQTCDQSGAVGHSGPERKDGVHLREACTPILPQNLGIC